MGKRILNILLRLSIAGPVIIVLYAKILTDWIKSLNSQHWLLKWITENEVLTYVIIIALILIISVFALKFFIIILNKLSPDRLQVISADPIGNEIFSSVYPFLTISYGLLYKAEKGAEIWIFGVIFLFLLLSKNTISYNLLFTLCGYRMYRIRNSIKIESCLLITKQKGFLLKETLNVINIDEYTWLDVGIKNKEKQ